MFKFLNKLFNNKHVHCFCDKKQDYYRGFDERVIVMACNKCGLEETHIYKGYQPKGVDYFPTPPKARSSIK